MSASVLRRSAAAGSLTFAVFARGAGPASAQDPATVPTGVFAGGVELAGLTLEAAQARLRERLGERLAQPIVVRSAGRRFTLTPARAKLSFDALTTAKRALRAAAPAAGTAPPAGGSAFGTDVPLAVRHSKLAVRAFVAAVAAKVHRAPRNATLEIGLKRMHTRRARTGIAVDAGALTAQVDAALDTPATARLIRRRVKTLYPPTNINDLRAQYRTVITVSKAERRLRLFKNLKYRKSYGVAVGQPAYPTPAGRFRIQEKQVNPVWSVPNSPWAGELGGSTVAGGSPANPLKARWMGITDGVGIHGTGEDWSIGTAASHGCLRMHVWDVKDLYPRVPVGTTIVIR